MTGVAAGRGCARGRAKLNYRHVFHAGNFADLMKHLVWLGILDALLQEASALCVVDTHAGAGLYDLTSKEALRSAEAAEGIGRAARAPAAPKAVQSLLAAVRAANPDGALTRYPGSPWLTAKRLRPGDRYLGCELRGDDFAKLSACLRDLSKAGGPRLEASATDGYLSAATALPGRTVFLVDPPFERGDEAAKIADLIASVSRMGAAAAVWAPLKDLESLDGLIRRLEAVDPGALQVAELRLRPPLDPMRMNGSAMVLVNAPGISPDVAEGLRWLADLFGPTASGGVRTYAGSGR